MKKLIKYSFLTLILFAVSACNNSDENQANDGKLDKVAIAMTCEMLGSRAASNLQGAFFDPSTEIGLHLRKSNGATDYGYANLYCTSQHLANGTDTILQSSQMYFPLANDVVDVDVRAYAPYDGRFGRIQTYDVDIQTDQSTSVGYLKSDLLYGVPTAGNPVHHVITHDPTKKTQNVKLTFHHLFSKVTLSLEAKASLSAADLVGAQVTLKQVASKVPFNLDDGSLGTASTPADVYIGEIATGGATVSGLLPPQTIDGGEKFIEVTLANGQVYDYTIPSATPLTLNGGRHYQFKMRVGTTDMDVTMSVADWVGVAGEYVF